MLNPTPQKKTSIILLLLGLGSFFIRLGALRSQPHPFGYDGYYYVTQLTRYVISGHLHSPESSWVIWMMVPMRLLLGDSILAVKLSSALLAALCVPGAYLAVSALSKTGQENKNWKLLPWLAAAWAAGSPVLSLLAAEFPKNLGMITAGLFFWASWWSKPTGKMHWVFLSALALLTMTAHRLGILLVFVLMATTSLDYLTHRRDFKKHHSWILALVIVGVAFLFVGLSYLFPNLLHPSDLQRLKGAFSKRPSFLPFAYFHLWSPSWALQLELGSGWMFLLIMTWAAIKSNKHRSLFIVFGVAFLLCNFPFWNAQHLDLGYRLGLLGPLFTLIPSVLSLNTSRAYKDSAHNNTRGHAAWVTICVIISAGWLFLSPLGVQANRMPPYDRYKAMIMRIPKPYPQKVIAHSGMNFYYGHLTKHPAVAWAPLASEDKTKIFRIAWGISDGEWLEFMQSQQMRFTPQRIDPDYTYLREDDWDAFAKWSRTSKFDDLVERIQSFKNPHRTKPGYLLRNWKEGLKRKDR